MQINDALPEDVISLIISLLPPKEICKCQFVCKYWKSIINENFWKKLFSMHLGNILAIEDVSSWKEEFFNWINASQYPLNKFYNYYKNREITDLVAENQENTLVFKVITIGEIGTGKTSIIKRYVHNIFSTIYKATIGVDFALKSVQMSDDLKFDIQLWDVAGQERFAAMTRLYYKNSHAAVIVCDVTQQKTIDDIDKWYSDLVSKLALDEDEAIPTIIIINKGDLITDSIQDRISKVEKYCKRKGLIGWHLTSAKNGTGIDGAFNQICQVFRYIYWYGKILEKKTRKKKKKQITLNLQSSERNICC